MKKYFFMTIAALAAALILFFNNSAPKEAMVSYGKRLTPEQMVGNYKLAKKQRRDTGYFKQDKPDKYVEYLGLLKNGIDGSGYAPNNTLIELKAARKRAIHLKTTSENLDWVERGPGNVGGRTRGVLVDPDDKNGNTWFVGSVGGGIWKTTDAGQNWISITEDWPNLAVSCLAMAPSNTNVLYAGTGEGFYNTDAIAGNGIFKSTNKGATWELLSSTAGNRDFRYVNRIVVDPNNPDKIYVATNYAIQLSTNGGGSFLEIYTYQKDGITARIQDLKMHPTNPNVLLGAVNGKGIVRTTDGGSTWNMVKEIEQGRIELCLSENFPNHMYAMTSESNLFYSKDAGVTWNEALPKGEKVDFLSGQGWYNNTMVAHPNESDKLYVGGLDIYLVTLSQDQITDSIKIESKQLTWWSANPTKTVYAHADHHHLTIAPIGGTNFRLVNGNDGGVAFSDDGGKTWNNPINGYNTSQFYGIARHPFQNQYLGGTQDNGTWTSGTNPEKDTHWSQAAGGDGFEAIWHVTNPDKRMLSLYYNRVYATNDGGASWEAMLQINGHGDDELSPFVTRLSTSTAAPDMVCAGGKNGISITHDFGKTWSLKSIPGKAWEGGKYNPQIAVSSVNPKYVWAGSWVGKDNPPAISQDGGETFTLCKAPFIDHSAGISEIVTHPSEEKSAFLLFAQKDRPKLFKSNDLGQTWTELSGFGSNNESANGFPNVAIYSMVVMPYNTDIIWVGTEIGIFESTNAGASWHIANNGLPAVCIWDMKIVDKQLVLGTHGRGVWSVDIPEIETGLEHPQIIDAAKAPDGSFVYRVQYPTGYDKIEFYVDDVLTWSLNNVVEGTIRSDLRYNSNASFIGMQIKAFKGDEMVYSNYYPVKNIQFESMLQGYSNDFSVQHNDFLGDSFVVSNELFGDWAIHSPHSYGEGQELTYMLKNPIKVLDAYRNAVVKYRDIALVEPGDLGTVFGDAEFWDYVVAEGSKDGLNWIPLSDGYDVNYSSKWEAFAGTNYDSIENVPGSTSMFENHTIFLHDAFDPGDVILFRFRLYSDAAAIGWGWVIDDLKIQEIAVDEKSLASDVRFVLGPNPTSDVLNVTLESEWIGDVTFTVYDLTGQTLLQRKYSKQAERWQETLSLGTVEPGIKLVRISTGNQSYQKKIMIR